MTEAIVEVITINEIQDHPNADMLEIIPVGGYNLIVKKDQFKIGDKGLFVSVDSVLPQDFIDFYNLEPYLHNKRIKTIRLRGEYSQGLLVSTDFLDIKLSLATKKIKSLAELLDIVKYQPPTKPVRAESGKRKPKWAKPVALFLNKIGIRKLRKFMKPGFVAWAHQIGFFDFRNNWPKGLRVYDLENIQSPKYRDWFVDDEPVIVTEKIHGRHVVCMVNDDNEFLVCSRKVHIDRPAPGNYNINWDPLVRIDIETKLKNLKSDLKHKGPIVLRGEIYGTGVQFLNYNVGKPQFLAFDLELGYNNYVSADELKNLCHLYDIPMVPVLYDGPFSYQLLEELAERPSTLGHGSLQEGIVIKPLAEYNSHNGRKILKMISKKYMMKSIEKEENPDV